MTGTYDGARIKLYVNGRLTVDNPCTTVPHQSADPLTFGYAGFHTRFYGAIDEIEIHGQALTAAQVRLLATTPLAKRVAAQKGQGTGTPPPKPAPRPAPAPPQPAPQTAGQAWQDLTTVGTWVNFLRGYNTLGVYKDGEGIVHLKGLVRGGAGQITALPLGFRPKSGTRSIFSVTTAPNSSASQSSRVDILPDGRVFLIAPPRVSWVSLDGIVFPGK